MTSPATQPAVPEDSATADLLRVIAHELRQPLSTIGSIAYYLTLILPREDEKIHEQLARLQQLVEQSSWILTNGQHLTGPLETAPELVDVEEMLTQIVAMRSGAGDLPLRLEFAGNLPQIEADPAMAAALIENLLTLFRLISSAEHPVTLRTSTAGTGIAVEWSTTTPGFRSESGLGPGAGLCLECARRMVERHHGTFDLSADPAAGVRIIVALPGQMLP